MHDDAFYVPKELFERWAERDPIERYRTWLREHADLTDDEEERDRRLREEAPERRAAARRGVAAARSGDAPRRRVRDARRPRHAPPQVMAEKTYLQAISDGLRQEMRRDKRVFVLGEDVGVYGGAFKVTLGLPGGVRPVARDRHAALGDRDPRRRDRRRDDGAAARRRDAVRRLRLVRVGPPRHRRGEAALARRHAGADRAAAARRAAASRAGRSTRRTRSRRSRTSPGSSASARRRPRTRRG